MNRKKLTAPRLGVERARQVRAAGDVAEMWPVKKRTPANEQKMAELRAEATRPRARILPAVAHGAAANDPMADMAAAIEKQLYRAVDIINRMPPTGPSFGGGGAGWPAVLHEMGDYGKMSTAMPKVYSNLDEADKAIAFLQMFTRLEQRERQLLMRKIVWKESFRDIGDALGCSHTQARRDYRAALAAFAAIVKNSSFQMFQKGV